MAGTRLARYLRNSYFPSIIVTRLGPYLTRSPTLHRRGINSTTRSKNGAAYSLEKDVLSPIEAILKTPSVDRIATEVVRDSIEKVFSKQIPGLSQVDSAGPYYLFVESNLDSLLYLDAFVRLSCSNNTSGIALLTPVELTNTLFMLKDQVKKGKFLKMSQLAPQPDNLEKMIESFLILLLNRKSGHVSVPVIVGGILKSQDKMEKYQKLFSAGLGNFLAEISMLPKQFTLSNLQSFEPILDGISWLDQEFSQYFQNFHQDFDEIYFKTLIPVSRYRHLLCALRNLDADHVKPSDLLCLIDDPIAVEVQAVLQEISGNVIKNDQLIFQTHRNKFNLLFCATGLGTFEKIFALIYQNLQSNHLKESERKQFEHFLQDFLPLLGSGALSSNQLGNVKYTCVIARFQDNVLVPYKIGGDVFENYEFSLLILLDLADYAYLLRAIFPKINKTFENCSVVDIEKSLLSYSEDKGSLVKQDVEKLIKASKVYAAYSLRSFQYWDKIVLDKRLVALMEQQELRHQHISELTPEIRDLLKALQETNNDIVDEKIDLEPYASVLAEIQDCDLKISYSAFSPRVLQRLIKNKIDQLKSEQGDRFIIDQCEALSKIMDDNMEQSSIDVGKLDGIANNERIRVAKRDEFKQGSPTYVQVPEFLKIHDFTEELIVFRDKVLLKKYKESSSEEIITCLKDEVEALARGLPSSLTSHVSRESTYRYAQLANRLAQLFMINGNDSEILDAIISSDRIFAAFENKLELNERRELEKATPIYLQLPDDCPLDSFVDELINLKAQLGGSFADFKSSEVLELIEKHLLGPEVLSSYGAYYKLHQNLVKLFRYNNGHTSILDALIVSDSALRKLDESLSKKRSQSASRNYTVASYQDELAKKRSSESSAKTTVIPTASHKENGKETDPSVLTAKQDLERVQFLAKNDLEQFLRKAKQEKVSEMEERFREREAYVWSASTLRDNGTLESKQFFSQSSKNKFPMFPGSDNNLEYLVLTSKGHVIFSKTNPLGATHIPEDMLSILERLSESDIVNYSTHLRKLQRKGWNLIGSKGQNQMLVLSRSPRSYKATIMKTAKLLLSTAGFVFITLLGVDYFVGEKDASVVDECQTNEELEASRDVSKDIDNVPEVEGLAVNENPENEDRASWGRLLWK